MQRSLFKNSIIKLKRISGDNKLYCIFELQLKKKTPHYILVANHYLNGQMTMNELERKCEFNYDELMH
jgi:hypothetical protein